MSKYGPRIKNMFSKFMEDNCMYYSAVVCFYILTCAVPMVLLIVTIVGFFPINASDFIYTALEYVFPSFPCCGYGNLRIWGGNGGFHSRFCS